MPNYNNNQEIRSEEVQDILSYVPSWMIRWGNTLLFLMLILIFFLSWLIKYPDVIQGEALITTEIPPEKIYSKTAGQFDSFLISEGEKVVPGDILAVIENSAILKDVLCLKSIVDTIDVNKEIFSFPMDQLPPLILGNITSSFSQFENDYSDYLLNTELTPFKTESYANKTSLTEAKARFNLLQAQKELNQEELVLNKKDLIRSRVMFEKGVISKKDLEKKEIEYLQAKRAFNSLLNSISQTRELIGNSKKNIEGTTIKKTQQDLRLKKKTIQSFLYLKKAIKDWENEFALVSSIPGEVSFLSFWDKTQTIKQNDLVFTIIPEGKNSFIAKIKAPANNSGKIKAGQRVQITLFNFPSDEFGELNGTVKTISSLPTAKGNYLIDVILPKDLKTTYNRIIPFKQEMQGTAKIITEDLRLLERVLFNIKDLLNFAQ